MNKRSLLILILAVFYINGCDNDNNDTTPPPPVEPPPVEPVPMDPPPPVDNRINFSSFVKTQLANTSDQAEPVDINTLEFVIDDDVNAFNDVF